MCCYTTWSLSHSLSLSLSSTFTASVTGSMRIRSDRSRYPSGRNTAVETRSKRKPDCERQKRRRRQRAATTGRCWPSSSRATAATTVALRDSYSHLDSVQRERGSIVSRGSTKDFPEHETCSSPLSSLHFSCCRTVETHVKRARLELKRGIQHVSTLTTLSMYATCFPSNEIFFNRERNAERMRT